MSGSLVANLPLALTVIGVLTCSIISLYFFINGELWGWHCVVVELDVVIVVECADVFPITFVNSATTTTICSSHCVADVMVLLP